MQRGCTTALTAPARLGWLWAHLVAELPQVLPRAGPAQGHFRPRDAADGGMDTGACGCRAITQLCSLVPQSTLDTAVPHAWATRSSSR